MGSRFSRISVIVGCVFFLIFLNGTAYAITHSTINFPMPLQEYQALEAGKNLSLGGILKHRVLVSPFNLIATILFLCAIIHTFFASRFLVLSKKIADSNGGSLPGKHFLATVCHFLGEVEAVFGLWAVPLLICMAIFFGWHVLGHYFNDVVSFAEPVFVVIIMAISATRPVLSLAESILRQVASLGKETVAAWWISILIVAPFMGSFITEPAAMTIGAMLLAKQFYDLRPSKKLCYATLGLLFVNVSVGGTLTHFAAPPIVMVAHKWHLTIGRVFMLLGSHAIVGVVSSTLIYYLIFRKEFSDLQSRCNGIDKKHEDNKAIPMVITITHCLFLAWTVLNLHTPALAIAGFLFFLAFVKATKTYQGDVNLKSPILVGFFLASLVTFGGLQEWWISPVLGSLKEFQLFVGSTILTAFNDNAAITYLSSLVSEFSTNPSMQKAVLSGAVTGGGLTVIANAPNPAGQNVLSKYFTGGISPLYLFLGAIIPTLLVALSFNCW
ncbi:MAG: putative Na+/H+ antiporter [Puniceicoccales bacterium]|nr:putative Na+/H+ antiporter [Puniceicoccales bacterium]